MAENNYRTLEPNSNVLRVGHLPYEVTAKDISAFFESFGTIKNLYLKRRAAKDSTIYLANPYVVLVFDNSESVDQIMAARPLYMGDCLLFVRRFIPHNPKYPHEAFLNVKKILIRTPSEQNDEILPDDKSIVDYLIPANGNIVYFERLDDKTVLVQFDDYDPVDICCLSRPHFIKDQPVEIEKCSDEEQVRQRIKSQKYQEISSI
jgi:RNA recognition motif-containing protein